MVGTVLEILGSVVLVFIRVVLLGLFPEGLANRVLIRLLVYSQQFIAVVVPAVVIGSDDC